MKTLKKYILSILFVLINAVVFAGQQGDGISVLARTDKSDALYDINEPVVFIFTSTAVGEVSYVISLDGRDIIDSNKTAYIGEPLKITSKLNKPGFLRCQFTFKPANNEQKIVVAGAAYEPLKIKASAVMPDDFDKFWYQLKVQLACIPINPVFRPIQSDSNKVDTFDVKMDCLGKNVYGYYARPIKAKAKSCSAIITLHGAGVSSARKDPITFFADNGFIALDINANGVENGKTPEYYANLYGTVLKNYRHWGKENQYTSYFTSMFIRVLRGLEFLKSQPEWNGKILVAYGASQGGAQSLAAAGLDSDVNLIFAGVPAMCDHGGYICGWPKLVPREADGSYNKQILDASMYNDCVNFARRAKARAIFTVGFVDDTCRPTSVYAAYNNYNGPKEIVNAPLNAHPVPPEYYEYAKKKILEFAVHENSFK
jgi:cephalosporin-C deacetylase-like acetyl esterase